MRKGLRLLKKALLILIGIGVSVCLFLAGFLVISGYDMYRQVVEEKSLAQRVEEVRSKPGYTTIDQLPELYLQAVVAVEDHRFYDHWGVDPFATLRALWNDIRAGAYVEGGSTITQQLAKNLCFTQEKELTRKVAELFVAFELERQYSKEEILELYVNSIYFGNGYYSIGEASRGYFQKEPSQLTPSECTLLAGIPNAPSVYALTASPELARERQIQVLRRMVDAGFIDQTQADAILAEGTAEITEETSQETQQPEEDTSASLEGAVLS